MRLVRVMKDHGPFYARVEGDKILPFLPGPFAGWPGITGEEWNLSEVRLLAPCCPSKVVGVGLNYSAHAQEMSMSSTEYPVLFLKPPSAVIGPGDMVVYPPMSHRVDYEGELAVVIGRQARMVLPEESSEYIFGYTCANDVTARDLQPEGGQWTLAKSFDTFCPLGPEVVTGFDPSDRMLRVYLNGVLRQEASTALMIHGVEKLVSYISQVMTLYPGDVILTGTPEGIGPMEPGDSVRVEIEGLGSLVNEIAKPAMSGG